MKSQIASTIVAVALACVAGTGSAQEQNRTINLQNVTVTGNPATYETYVVDLHLGYGLQALVGNTHSQFVQARRAAEHWEAQRTKGMAPQSYVAVAIDNSGSPGVARQFQLTDGARKTVAIVNAYCKAAVPAGTDHCRLVPMPVAGGAPAREESLASR